MKTLLLTLTLVALLLITLGCATATPAPTVAPAPTSAPAPTTVPVAPTNAPPANVGTDPASIAQAFEAALNAGNLDAAMALIADDAVFKNTPPSGATLTGKEQIQVWVKRQVDTKTTGKISDLQVQGDTAFFKAQAFRGGSPLGSGGTSMITVKDGKIVLRDFAAKPPSSASNADPIAVVQGYIAARNAKKIDEALAYFADDAVLDHPLFGKHDTPEKIRARLAIEADRHITFETGNFQANGENVTWDQKVFRGGEKIGEGANSALVVNGKIKSLGETPAAAQSTQSAQIATDITDPWGVVVVPKGGAIQIALMGGFFLPFMQGEKIAAQLAVQDFAPDMKIEIVEVEDHSSVPWTKGAETVVANPNFAAAIGPMASNAGLAETEILDKAHVTMISASATADELTARGLQTFNRTYPRDSVQAEYSAQFAANTLKFTRGAIVYDDTTYGRGLGQAFKAAFEKNGGTVTDYVARQPGESDYAALLKQLASNQPQFVYFAAFGEIGAEFAKQKNAAGLKEVALLGPDAFFDSEILALAGADAEGVYSPLFRAPRNATYEAFAKKFAAAGGTEAQMSAAPNAYDAMAILLNAIKQVGQVDKNGNFVIGRQALANAVRATKNFAGASGDITFDANGDRTTSAFAMFQVQGGKWVAVVAKP